MRGSGPDAHKIAVPAYPGDLRQSGYVHYAPVSQFSGRCLPNRYQQVGAARNRSSARPRRLSLRRALRHVPQGVLQTCRPTELNLRHRASLPLRPRMGLSVLPRSTRSMSMGSALILLPEAWQIALAMAAAPSSHVGSPMVLAPYGP